MSKKSTTTKGIALTKDMAIKAYIKIKKKNRNINVDYNQFIKNSIVTKSFITEHFGTYTRFKVIAYPEFVKSLPVRERALLSEMSKKFDPDATKDLCIEDLRSVQNENDMLFISRTVYRNKGKYSDSTWNQYFGTFQEFRRQAGLELTRHQHKIERGIAKHAAHDHYTDYVKEQLLPYYRKYEKKKTKSHIKTIMIISDVHDVEACEFTVATFISECKRKQPDIVVLNGDIFDLYEFSRYTKDSREYDIVGRFQYVWKNLFAPLRKACPNAQIDFVMGNHEFRLIKLLADATPNVRVLLSDLMGLSLADVFKLDKYQINLVSKFNLSAFSSKEINNELKQNYQIYYNCYVVCHEPDSHLTVMSGTNGHHHRLSQVSTAFPDPSTGQPKQVTWVQTPAAHRRDASYLNNISKWNTGFLEVIINIKHKEVIQKIHQTHHDWTIIDGIHYERKEKK